MPLMGRGIYEPIINLIMREREQNNQRRENGIEPL
jgi:hypothetical protein